MNRRTFVKTFLNSIWSLFLVSCNLNKRKVTPTTTKGITNTPKPSNTPSPTSTSTPTKTGTPTDTPSPVPTDTPIPCFTLVSPEPGSEWPDIGRITFSWTEQIGANNYLLEITYPIGITQEFNTESLSYEMYLASLRMGGEYSWRVIALDENGEEICMSGPRTFFKEEFVPTPTKKNKKKNNNGGTSSTTSTGSAGANTFSVTTHQ